MADFLNIKSDFLDSVVSIIERNLSDEKFGVSELAEEVGMSRSNLLRKVQKITNLSVSVLIRNVRLHHAQQMLQNDSLNVSEVSYKVGFSSVSYFIKCYRELYGYPPGEEGKKVQEEIIPAEKVDFSKKPRLKWWLVPVMLVIGLAATYFFWQKDEEKSPESAKKSIAVLPFHNDSGDSSNVYIINGLMEAILNNLQKIEDLRVISRTSVEKYRESSMTISEISDELDVNYIIEGSGQKRGGQILLTIQLIEAPTDNHLWSERYNRDDTDIFQLQAEVSKNIAKEIKAIVTPEEAKRIDKTPTDNLEAYDLYLKGMDLTTNAGYTELAEAIQYFEKALELDSEFPQAHAMIAICYYYLDLYRAQKKYGNEINTHADKALLLDAELGMSLMAKGLFYMQDGQYELAAEYGNKALKFNPNSAHAYNFLSSIYAGLLPDTEKYLTYALKGIQLDRTGVDSATTSMSYLHLGNALAQNGFLNEAEKHIKTSLAYDSSNIFSQYVLAYILLGQDKDLSRTKDLLIKVLAKDTTRLDVVQEVAKMYYVMKDYEASLFYYDKFIKAKEEHGLNVFESENLKIGWVLDKLGKKDEAAEYFEKFKTYAENDNSMYKDLSLSAYYAATGDIESGIEHLKKASNQENYQYWFVLFLDDDPILQTLSSHADFRPTVQKITDQFWQEHNKIKAKLEEEGLL